MLKTVQTSRDLTVGVSAIVVAFAAHAGGSYRFTVTCQHTALVAQWNTGDIDPGKEFLRVSTGTKHPGCSVGDFQAARDGHLPVTTYSGPSGVFHGIPLVGSILGRIFRF